MPEITRRAVLGAGGMAMAASAASGPGMARRGGPVVIGHRGASALRPEHTIASYARAVADGADFIEPDLVVTKDGVLVVRHENNIAETTDVAAHGEFADRRTEKTIDGEKQVGWFTEDFKLAELKTLRARERLPRLRPANAAMDGWFDVPSWADVIDFAAAISSAYGRPIGLVPELKHSTYFVGIGLPLEDRFLASIAAHHHTSTAPLIVQSFEVSNLGYLRGKLGRPANVQLMQLVIGSDPDARPADKVAAGESLRYTDMVTADGLKAISGYADIVAPDSRSIIPLDAKGRLGTPTALVGDAHRAGLLVQPWTFRPENYFLPRDMQGAGGPAARNPAGAIAEIRAYLAAGIDGFFADDPAIGRLAVDET